MDPQCSSHEQKVQHVAHQIFKAMNQSQHPNESNIITFLNKLYKNNSSSKNKKMKSIRLNRFINLLEYMVGEFPTQASDMNILYHCIGSTLANDKNFGDEEDDELIESMGIQFAKVIEKIVQVTTHASGSMTLQEKIATLQLVIKLLSHFIKGQSISLSLGVNEFQQKIRVSTYFQNINLDNNTRDDQPINYEKIGNISSIALTSSLQTVVIKNVILKHLNLETIYSGLFTTVESQQKWTIVDLFYQHVKKVQALHSPSSRNMQNNKSRKQLFMKVFLSAQRLTIPQAQSILKILEKQIFDKQCINQSIKKISREKLTLSQLLQIDFRKLKGIQEIFIQSLIHQTSKLQINQLINIFISMKDKFNYFPLYLILKLNKKIPLFYIDLLFQKAPSNTTEHPTFTIRKSIIFILSIIDNIHEQQSFHYLLQKFNQFNDTNNKQPKQKHKKSFYLTILKAIHFSLENISKATVISMILKYIHKVDLNSQTSLEYLAYNPLKVSTHEEMKKFLNEKHREILAKLFGILNQFDDFLKKKSSVMSKSSSSVEKNSLKQQGSSSLLSLQSNISTTLQPSQKLLQIQHKIKLDLEFLTHTNPYIQQQLLSTIKQLNQILIPSSMSTQKSLTTLTHTSNQQLLKKLPIAKQNLLQILLMWTNNKYDTFYSQQLNTITFDWAMKAYKKYSTDLNNELKNVLEKDKLEKYYKLIKSLIEYGMEKRCLIEFDKKEEKGNKEKDCQKNDGNIVFSDQIREVINASNLKTQRMNSNTFNDYFLTESKWKSYITALHHNKSNTPINSTLETKHTQLQKQYKKIIWIKTILIELKQFIKNMIKAQKVGNRKQLKIIITENIEDILALKIIHEYFSAGIQLTQGKPILLQIFHSIQPQFQFFDRTQKLAQLVNMQYYNFYNELPHLLENFNSDTLNFLSKLIVSNSSIKGVNNNQQQPNKKKNKKKNDKQAMIPEDCSKCMDIVVKNIGLLFSQANDIQSYKSLFVILKKVVQSEKINKEQLSTYINTWLFEINFIPCSNFQTWKQKVLSLTKMWKNITDLFWGQKRIQLKVIEKHFNLFTDLLNKLYQNFREESQFLDIEQRILLTLCLLYKQLDFSEEDEKDKMKMELEGQEKISSVDMTEFIVKKFQQNNISRLILDNRYYQCYQCKKKACYACSSFLHRNHDKIYLGKTGVCQHETSFTTVNNINSQSKFKKQQAILMNKGLLKQSGALFGGVSALLKKNQDLPEQLIQRYTQKLMYAQQINNQDQMNFFIKLKQHENLKQIYQHKQSRQVYQKKRSKQKQSVLGQQSQQNKNIFAEKDFIESEIKDTTSHLDKITTLTPQSQQYFQYKPSYCQQFKKIHTQLHSNIIPKFHIKNPKINISPLSKVFIRQLQNQTFTYEQESHNKQLQNKNVNEIKTTEIKDKYLFFKNQNLIAKDNQKNANNNNDYAYRNRGNTYGTFGTTSTSSYNPTSSIYQPNQNLITASSYRRNLITCNSKYVFYPSNLSMISLSFNSLKNRLQKKIQNKQFVLLQQQKTYQCYPPVPNLPFQINQCSFSKSSSYPILACVGYNQLCFYPILADGRLSRQINPQFHRMDPIIKFSWINENKNLLAICYQNYIRVGGISPSNNIRTFAKVQIGSSKQIRYFDGIMNSKLYAIYIVDTEGKVYFVEVDFSKQKQQNNPPTNTHNNRDRQPGSRNAILSQPQSTIDRALNIVDQHNNKIENFYSIKCIDNNRILLSCTNGMLRVSQPRSHISSSSTEKSTLKTFAIDLRKAMKIQTNIVLDSIKVIKCDEQSILVSGITRKISNFDNLKQPRRPSGSLIIINIKIPNIHDDTSTQHQNQIFYLKQQNIESYDCSFTNPNSLMFVYFNQQGMVYSFKYNIQMEQEQIVEKIPSLNISTTEKLKEFNRKLISHKIFQRIEQGGMIKNFQFKDNKNITNGFTVSTTKEKGHLLINDMNYCHHFVTGVVFTVELPSSVNEYMMTQHEHQMYDNNESMNQMLQVTGSEHRQKYPTAKDKIPFLTLQIKILNTLYTFNITTKTRQIQLPFNIKQTLQLFVTKQNHLNIQFNYKINQKLKLKYSQKQIEQFVKIKNVFVHGYDAKDIVMSGSNANNNSMATTDPSIYHTAFRQLVNNWFIYQEYPVKESLEQYWLNPYRTDFYNMEMKRLNKLHRYDSTNNNNQQSNSSSPNNQSFKMSQINMFLKLELFTQTVGYSLQAKNTQPNNTQQKQQIQQILNGIKKYLLTKNYRRKSIENSVLRLCSVVCNVYGEKNANVTPGHPYHSNSIIHFHQFSKLYEKWKGKKIFTNFEKLCTQLSDLIIYQAVDLWIILELYPELITQISSYFNLLITEKRHKQQSYDNDTSNGQNSLTRLCSKYISIVCQYYQVMKNKNIQKSQQKILHLLEQVFGVVSGGGSSSAGQKNSNNGYNIKPAKASISQTTKQIIMNPFIYLQSVFNEQQTQQLNCSVDIFNLNNKMAEIQEFSLSYHVKGENNRKKSLYKQQQLNQNKIRSQNEQYQESTFQIPKMGERNWHRRVVQQQKQLDQQQKQMYNVMDIQQDGQFDENIMNEDQQQQDIDQQEIMMLDQAEQELSTLEKEKKMLQLAQGSGRLLSRSGGSGLSSIIGRNNNNNLNSNVIADLSINSNNVPSSLNSQIPNNEIVLQLPQQSNIQPQNKPSSLLPHQHKTSIDESITKILVQKTLSSIKKLTITHYDFSVQLAIALFRKQNYLTSQNAYFYLGLLYNLLKIIEDNFLKGNCSEAKQFENSKKIFELIHQIDKRIENPSYSCLWIVINFFISPRFTYQGQPSNSLTMAKPRSRLSQHFIQYYFSNLPRFIYLLTQFTPKSIPSNQQMIKLSDIIKFQPFQLENQLYTIKLISNIYLAFRLNQNKLFSEVFLEKNDMEDERMIENIKQSILFKVVRYGKISTLRNIMLYEKWEGQLDRAKILVSFNMLMSSSTSINSNINNLSTKRFDSSSDQIQKGINMLYECSKSTPSIYINELINDEQKVIFLEQFVLKSNEQLTSTSSITKIDPIKKKVFELLDVYYNS